MTTDDYAPKHPTAQERAEFDARLAEARAEEDARTRMVNGSSVALAPQNGAQTRFMTCPMFECLVHGPRGNGKSLVLLMAFCQEVGERKVDERGATRGGHGAAWRGVIFRQTYPQLADIVAKSQKWFPAIFPGVKFNHSRMEWHWPTGEVLMFRHFGRVDDYWNYHGWEVPFIGWEELTNWPTDECYTKMFSCCRPSAPGVPLMVRATTNPFGAGHSWIKERFRLHGEWWKTIVQPEPRNALGKREKSRCAIYGHTRENRILLDADPEYQETITSSTTNPELAKAWAEGSWDIVSGGMFGDVWNPKHNIVPRFEVPGSWTIDRAFDWGSRSPFAVGWFAESDGSDLLLSDGRIVSTVPGDLFVVHEWYGWTGQPNQGVKMLATDIAAGIVEREIMWGWRQGRLCRVEDGPADTNIYNVENGMSIADDMEQPVRVNGQVYQGISWTRADKRAHSRAMGWEMVRKAMAAAKPRDGLPREMPGLFVVGDNCPQFLRTIPNLPRSETKPDDIEKKSQEDHWADALRYRVRAIGTATAGSGTTSGIY